MSKQRQLNRLEINPSHVRYIKLGPSNNWFTSCKENDRIEFGHSDIQHDLALTVDKPAIAAAYVKQGRTPSKANDFAREVIDIYSLNKDCLWITFAEGCLWWAFSQPAIEVLEDASNDKPVRYRRTIGPWSNKNINDEDLSFNTLSSVLTKVAAYQQTLCRVEASDYLIRRINCVDSPIIAEAKSLRSDLVKTISNIISNLHWRDFEVLCDLIFARALSEETDLIGTYGRPTLTE